MSLEALDKNNSKQTEGSEPPSDKQKLETLGDSAAAQILKRIVELGRGTKFLQDTLFVAIEEDERALFEYIELNATKPTEKELLTRINEQLLHSEDGDDTLIRRLDRLYHYGKRLGYAMDLEDVMDQWYDDLYILQWAHGKGGIVSHKLLSGWLKKNENRRD